MAKQTKVAAKLVTAGAKACKQQTEAATRPKTKLARMEIMLRRPEGATIAQLAKTLDWQAHSVRGAMSGALKKKQGLTITSEKTDNGRRVYRIAA